MTRASRLFIFVSALCFANSAHSTPWVPPPAAVSIMEAVDTGDDPQSPGCEQGFEPDDTDCSKLRVSHGDFCESKTKLWERTTAPNCHQGKSDGKSYDCTKVLEDPNGKCVWVEDYCHPADKLGTYGSKSAFCQTVPTANPTPSPYDYCTCPTNSGETIVSNECPTRLPGDECNLKGCYVSKNGEITYRFCAYSEGGQSSSEMGGMP
jgi:hypothetical protein